MNAIKPNFRRTDLIALHVRVGLPDACAVAAGLYEKNGNYQQAEICRSALEALIAAERQAMQALDRAMCRVQGCSTTPPKEDPNHGKS
jgi:hypothetical protein